MPGRDAFFLNEIGDAVRQHARFSAARARENEKRPFRGLDRLALSVV